MLGYFKAYYFALEATGDEGVDRILEAVARAGKSYHHTEMWNEPGSLGEHSCIEEIERAAKDAAVARKREHAAWAAKYLEGHIKKWSDTPERWLIEKMVGDLKALAARPEALAEERGEQANTARQLADQWLVCKHNVLNRNCPECSEQPPLKVTRPERLDDATRNKIRARAQELMAEAQPEIDALEASSTVTAADLATLVGATKPDAQPAAEQRGEQPAESAEEWGVVETLEGHKRGGPSVVLTRPQAELPRILLAGERWTRQDDGNVLVERRKTR